MAAWSVGEGSAPFRLQTGDGTKGVCALRLGCRLWVLRLRIPLWLRLRTQQTPQLHDHCSPLLPLSEAPCTEACCQLSGGFPGCDCLHLHVSQVTDPCISNPLKPPFDLEEAYQKKPFNERNTHMHWWQDMTRRHTRSGCWFACAGTGGPAA